MRVYEARIRDVLPLLLLPYFSTTSGSRNRVQLSQEVRDRIRVTTWTSYQIRHASRRSSVCGLSLKMATQELQIYTAVIEDRYPRAISVDVDVRDVLESPSYVLNQDTSCIILQQPQKKTDGCIVFLFGRSQRGRSVCLRVEGFRPRLYFEVKGGDTELSVQKELENEVYKHLNHTRIECEVKVFTHDYGYEPDAASPSGRKVHHYIEASYPNMSSYRAAVQIRRDIEIKKKVRQYMTFKEELSVVETRMLELKRQAMQPGKTHDALNHIASRFKEAEKRSTLLRDEILPALKLRLDSLDEDKVNESVDDEETRSAHGETTHDDLYSEHRFAHESNVEPLTRFFQEEGIVPGKWLSLPVQESTFRCTSCEIELEANRGSMTLLENDMNAPYVTLYYDIETLGLDPEVHPVIQISMVFEYAATCEKHIVLLGDADVSMLPEIIVHACATEEHVLLAFAQLVREKNPDNIVAYNGVNFDNRFLHVRSLCGHANAVENVEDFAYTSRFLFRAVKLRDLRLASNGMGENNLRYFDMHGRSNFDWFIKLKRDLTSEPSYKLNHFARKFCGDQKEDMSYKLIPILQAGTAQDRAKLASYCVHDSYLLKLLNDARTMLIEIIEFAAVFGIVTEWVYFRGQQVRFIAQLLEKARTAEQIPLLLNTPKDGFCGEGRYTKFAGATVNTPKKGFYNELPTMVCDWQSLYPSIMRAHNLCHSTWVNDPALIGQPGIVEHDLGDKKTYFADASRQKGILPIILQELGEKRKQAKGQVKYFSKRVKDDTLSEEERARAKLLASIHDGRQLALKVGMNSIYGATGAGDTGKFPNLDISATVTAEGRHAMVIKKDILPKRFGQDDLDIIYGDTDSVMLISKKAVTIEEAGVLGEEIGEYVTQHFASLGLPQMVLEFEKAYLPYLLQDKKRYAGLKYEPDSEGVMQCKGIDCKGIETERRDTLPFVKDILVGVLDALMYQKSTHAALQSFETAMETFVRGEVPYERFIMKKNLSAKVQDKTDSIVQAKVNADRKRREAGSEVSVNEQVEYVIVNGHRQDKTTQLAQDPEYAREQKMKLNYLWYFEHAIREPVRKMLGLFPELKIQEVFDRYSRVLNGVRLNVDTQVLQNLVTKPAAASSSGDGLPTRVVPRLPPRNTMDTKPPPKKKAATASLSKQEAAPPSKAKPTGSLAAFLTKK